MQVKLLTSTKDIVDTMYTAARTCYSVLTPTQILKEAQGKTLADKIKFLDKVIGSGHFSVSEHANFTFAIEGVSRSFLAQLTRHRIASYSVQSMRYVDFTKKILNRQPNPEQDEFSFADELVYEFYVVPKKLKEGTAAYNEYIRTCYKSLNSYCRLVEGGTEPEDARGILGNNFKTNIVCTFNFRSLVHLCNERLCTRAQQESRQVVSEMAKCVIAEHPYFERYLQAKCVLQGRCTEAKSCGRM